MKRDENITDYHTPAASCLFCDENEFLRLLDFVQCPVIANAVAEDLLAIPVPGDKLGVRWNGGFSQPFQPPLNPFSQMEIELFQEFVRTLRKFNAINITSASLSSLPEGLSLPA